MQGTQAIMTYLTEKLSFKTVRHIASTVDCQPLMDGGILVMVMGQLMPDQDKPMGFCENFVLRQDPTTGSYVIAHGVFRLVLHNG